MDYEQEYKKALERAKKLYKDAVTLQLEQDIKDYETIFPELTESKDERIRKELIEHIKANCESDFILFQKFSPDDVVAWLEKQAPKIKWTEEDEKCIDNCCLLIGAADDCYEKPFKDDCIHYLQSLKERMKQ